MLHRAVACGLGLGLIAELGPELIKMQSLSGGHVWQFLLRILISQREQSN